MNTLAIVLLLIIIIGISFLFPNFRKSIGLFGLGKGLFELFLSGLFGEDRLKQNTSWLSIAIVALQLVAIFVVSFLIYNSFPLVYSFFKEFSKSWTAHINQNLLQIVINTFTIMFYFVLYALVLSSDSLLPSKFIDKGSEKNANKTKIVVIIIFVLSNAASMLLSAYTFSKSDVKSNVNESKYAPQKAQDSEKVVLLQSQIADLKEHKKDESAVYAEKLLVAKEESRKRQSWHTFSEKEASTAKQNDLEAEASVHYRAAAEAQDKINDLQKEIRLIQDETETKNAIAIQSHQDEISFWTYFGYFKAAFLEVLLLFTLIGLYVLKAKRETYTVSSNSVHFETHQTDTTIAPSEALKITAKPETVSKFTSVFTENIKKGYEKVRNSVSNETPKVKVETEIIENETEKVKVKTEISSPKIEILKPKNEESQELYSLLADLGVATKSYIDYVSNSHLKSILYLVVNGKSPKGRTQSESISLLCEKYPNLASGTISRHIAAAKKAIEQDEDLKRRIITIITKKEDE